MLRRNFESMNLHDFIRSPPGKSEWERSLTFRTESYLNNQSEFSRCFYV